MGIVFCGRATVDKWCCTQLLVALVSLFGRIYVAYTKRVFNEVQFPRPFR